jgi:glycosyltransferase involved in cell wall biosynthesis
VRITYLTPHSELAGGELALLDLCRRLNRPPFQLHVILPRPGGFSRALEQNKISFAIVPFRRDFLGGYPPAFDLGAIRRIAALLAEWKADLLHLQDSYLTLLGTLAARSSGIPVVLTAHGAWDAHFFYQDLLNRIFLRRIWTPTESVAKSIRRRGFVKKETVRVVPFGIDSEKFSPGDSSLARKKLKLPPEVPLVARIARFDSVKDYPTFLKAAELLAEAHPTVEFVVVGDTVLDIPSESASNKQVFFDFLDARPALKKRVHWVGYQSDVRDYLAAADILVSSSLSESFGFTLLEAMAMERPVVSTNVGGPSEIVDPGLTGYLVPPKSASELADAVLKLINDPVQSRAMGIEGRRRLLEKFDARNFAATMEREYRDLLSPGGS